MTLRSKTFIGVAMVAALVLGPVLTDVASAKKGKGGKEKVQVSLSTGGKFSANKKKLLVAAYEPTVRIFTLSATSVKRRGRSVTTKTLQLGCSVDLASATLPVTASCAGQYSETGFSGRTPIGKSWAGDGITATFTAFDGSRASGTFEGTFVDNTGGLPPQTFSSGQFSLNLDF